MEEETSDEERSSVNAPKYSRQHFCMNRISFFYTLKPIISIILYITYTNIIQLLGPPSADMVRIEMKEKIK